jgi:hypothetical protein
MVFSDRIYLCLSTLPIPMWNYCDQSSEMKSSASREEAAPVAIRVQDAIQTNIRTIRRTNCLPQIRRSPGGGFPHSLSELVGCEDKIPGRFPS